MNKLHRFIAACVIAMALAAVSTPRAQADALLTPGVFFGNGSGFGGNLGTTLTSFPGGTASLVGSATIANDSHNTSFGLGADVVGHAPNLYFGGGANVFFPSCSNCKTAFSPDVLVGFGVAPLISLEARYYFSTPTVPGSNNNGLFFTGLQFKLP